MKKVSIILLVAFFIVNLSGCKANVKLEEGQTYTILDSKGKMTMSVFLSDKEFDGSYGIDFDDDDKEIKEGIVDLFDDVYGMDVEISKFKKGKDYVKFTLTSTDAKDFGYDLRYTLEDYAEDSYYDDVDDMSEYESFVLYKNDKDLDEDQLEDYEDAIVIYVYGGEEGSYYKLPGKILLVDDNMDYKKISGDTIFIEDDEYGIIVIEK